MNSWLPFTVFEKNIEKYRDLLLTDNDISFIWQFLLEMCGSWKAVTCLIEFDDKKL